jgi:hypothetical protein
MLEEPASQRFRWDFSSLRHQTISATADVTIRRGVERPKEERGLDDVQRELDMVWIAWALLAVGIASALIPLNIPRIGDILRHGASVTGVVTGIECGNHNTVDYSFKFGGRTYAVVSGRFSKIARSERSWYAGDEKRHRILWRGCTP